MDKSELREVLLVVSDMHIGSTLGLCAPAVNLDDGGTYQANRGQRWLWDSWGLLCDKFSSYQNVTKTVILNGDIIESDDKDRSWQLVTRNPATLLSMIAFF